MIQYDEGLTPIEEYNGIFYKRDDLYAPYGEDFVTGGKIRQCRDLIKTNLDHIKEECGSTISTASSIHSPQAVIVSKVAEEFGLKSIIGFGNTTVEKALKKKPMKMCADLGSEMVVLSESQGFNNVLYASCRDNGGLKYIDIDNPNKTDFNQWQTYTGNYYGVQVVSNKLFTIKSDRIIYELELTGLIPKEPLQSIPIDFRAGFDQLVLTFSNEIQLFDNDLNLIFVETIPTNSNLRFSETLIENQHV